MIPEIKQSFLEGAERCHHFREYQKMIDAVRRGKWPCRSALDLDHNPIVRRFDLPFTHVDFWNNPQVVLDHIKEKYKGGTRLVVDVNDERIYVHKILFWDEAIPGCEYPKNFGNDDFRTALTEEDIAKSIQVPPTEYKSTREIQEASCEASQVVGGTKE